MINISEKLFFNFYFFERTYLTKYVSPNDEILHKYC